jgi:hypothetical protein
LERIFVHPEFCSELIFIGCFSKRRVNQPSLIAFLLIELKNQHRKIVSSCLLGVSLSFYEQVLGWTYTSRLGGVRLFCLDVSQKQKRNPI